MQTSLRLFVESDAPLADSETFLAPLKSWVANCTNVTIVPARLNATRGSIWEEVADKFGTSCIVILLAMKGDDDDDIFRAGVLVQIS